MTFVSGIRLFERDPDLLHLIAEGERPRAAYATVVPALRVGPGAFDPRQLGSPRWGALILDGLMAREVEVASTAAAELLGTGDLISRTEQGRDEIVVTRARWTVLETVEVALLDDRFHAVLRHWPEVAGCLIQRSERRAARLAVAQAISHLNRIDTRVHVMLWTLAGRWGRVTPEGIAVPLRLTHRTISRLVGARRPSVTTAITALSERGLVARREDGSWMLQGPPPEELERVGVDRILARPAPHLPTVGDGVAPPVHQGERVASR
ncbi:MAG TPA: helix-turn-helix domain-containing protein [Capillimicrobium sp.]